MVSIVAKKYDYVVGVDTHAKKHVFALINNIGELIGCGEFRVLARDFQQLLFHIKRKTEGAQVLFAIEGTSSYGETLTRFLMQGNEDVCEVKPPKAKARGSTGKSDRIDAEMAARGVLHLPMDKLIRPRRGNERKILRTSLSSRGLLVRQQTMDKNALCALVRTTDIGIDARKALDNATIHMIATSRSRALDAPHEAVVRAEAKRLAENIADRNIMLRDNKRALRDSVNSVAPGILSLCGVGPVCAAQILCAYSHKGRIHSAEAFAMLAGVAPIPASSGNTNRHRLNKYGDRTLNKALDVIARNRMRVDAATQIYVAKRTADGLSSREIRRSLKRYIARSIFRYLETLNLGVD